jgi:hypothetical protein
MSCNFKITGNKSLEEWVTNSKESLDTDKFNELMTVALNIGRLSLKHANYNEENGMKELICETISATLAPQKAGMDTLVSEFRKIGFGNEGSSKKGKSNEILILKKLTSEIANWEFTKVSSDAMNCDLLATNGDDTVAIELKDYTHPVPSKEIKKFIRDVASKCPTAGLFLSTTNITGQDHDYCVDNRMINGKITPLLFVANASPASWVLAFLLLEELMNRKGDTQTIDNQQITIAINTFMESINDSINRLTSLDSEISRMRSEYIENRKKITDLLDDTYKSIFMLEMNMKIELQSIIGEFTKHKLDRAIVITNDCIVMNSKSFNEWVAGNTKADAYVTLYNAAKACKCKIGLDKKKNSLTVLAPIDPQGFFPLASTTEKPASIQLIYNFPIKDGEFLHYNYEVASPSGQIYFNLCKIKDTRGEEILKQCIEKLMANCQKK